MSVFINTIIKLIIRYPQFMETSLFEKIMLLFPSQIANRYDKTIANRDSYDAPFIESFKYLNLDANFKGKVLDLCTGTGFASLAFASSFPHAEIIAIDQSQAMLNLAIEKANSRNIKNVHFKKEVASNLPFTDNSFDLVMVSNAPFYFDEVIRVLKPSGQYLVTLSFGGKSIVESRKRISEYFQQYSLKLIEIKQVENGAFILSVLEDN